MLLFLLLLLLPLLLLLLRRLLLRRLLLRLLLLMLTLFGRPGRAISDVTIPEIATDPGEEARRRRPVAVALFEVRIDDRHEPVVDFPEPRGVDHGHELVVSVGSCQWMNLLCFKMG